jgi:uncharacterized membrane protein YphA (DoxX/SURF4 family)
MNITLWILQVLLAFAFLVHGWMFLAPPPEIAVIMNESLPRWFQLFLGVAEVAAAVGLTLPRLTNVKPWLVSWAAGGLMLVTGSATVLHLARNEFGPAATTTLLFVLSAIVTYGRRERPAAMARFESPREEFV